MTASHGERWEVMVNDGKWWVMMASDLKKKASDGK